MACSCTLIEEHLTRCQGGDPAPAKKPARPTSRVRRPGGRR